MDRLIDDGGGGEGGEVWVGRKEGVTYQVPPAQQVCLAVLPDLCPPLITCRQPFSALASKRGIHAVT